MTTAEDVRKARKMLSDGRGPKGLIGAWADSYPYEKGRLLTVLDNAASQIEAAEKLAEAKELEDKYAGNWRFEGAFWAARGETDKALAAFRLAANEQT